MEKRVLLAVALSFIVLYAFQALFPQPKSGKPPATGSPQAANPDQSKPSPNQPAEAPATPAEPPSAPLVGDAAEREIVVENDAVRAVFTTRGASLKSWQLKKYSDGGGRPLELVPQGLGDKPRPFTLSVPDAEVSAALARALYRPGRTEVRISGSTETLAFDYQDASGLQARKEFTFSPQQPYVVLFSATVSKNGEIVPTVEWGPALGSGRVVETMGVYSPPPQPVFYKDGKVKRVSHADVQENAAQEGVFGFAGVDDHYFLSAAVPGSPGLPLQVRYRPVEVPEPGAEKPARFVEWSARFNGSPNKARFYIGPKDFDALKGIDPDLTYAIDFGMFRWFVVPLLSALQWVHGYVGNYGWSIIILTAIINLAMFPLRHKSVVSMRKMQDIQPEMKAIQDRYAKLKMSDPQRQKMNVELMNLYRERGVNPASGCVPMLLTLPVLFAFYSMLSVAIELRGAPFIGWIKDLSVYDPLFITPVLMGITQFVQTRMTPTTADPMQQKMMLFMPIIFMAMLLWAPSGLVLYWTVSNAWAIGQQTVTNRLIGPPTARSVRPPAERQIKNAGGGKTNQASKERK